MRLSSFLPRSAETPNPPSSRRPGPRLDLHPRVLVYFEQALIHAQPLRLSPSEGPCRAKGGILPDSTSTEPPISSPWVSLLGSACLLAEMKEFVMPKNKDFKRLVRTRQKKTGESYTSARRQILRKKNIPRRDFAAIAGMSDEAVARKTRREWSEWVAFLDQRKAYSWPHREIARTLQEELSLPAWWAQTVTVGYERIKGLRAKNQRSGGRFEISKSMTLPVALETLYGAFQAAKRRRWLGDFELELRQAKRLRSMRARCPDGTPLQIHFFDKGPGKSQVQLQHGGLHSKKKAEQMRAFWSERLKALARSLRARQTR